jgi:hypothetical protein
MSDFHLQNIPPPPSPQFFFFSFFSQPTLPLNCVIKICNIHHQDEVSDSRDMVKWQGEICSTVI